MMKIKKNITKNIKNTVENIIQQANNIPRHLY